MVLFASGGFGTATMLFFADGEALGVSLGVAIDTAKEGVLAADVFVLDATLLGGKAEGDAGTVAVEAGAFHEAGIDCIANFASWSDNFKGSFFLIVASRSAQAVLYNFLYLSASASSALMSASVKLGLLSTPSWSRPISRFAFRSSSCNSSITLALVSVITEIEP